MVRTKATVRRLRTPTFLPAPEQRIGNKNILNTRLRNAPFKSKKILPEQRRGQKKRTSSENNERV